MPKPPDISAIYGIRHVESGRIYVGSALRLQARWRAHRNQLASQTHHSRYLQAAWNKYGPGAFEFVVLETVSDPANLLELENTWMSKCQSADSRFGFNVCGVAGSQMGMKHTPEARRKMSAAHTGKQKTDAHQAAINASLTGRNLSAECKQKLSAGRQGSSLPVETRAKMSESRRGKKASPAAREKISAAAKARHAAARALGQTIAGKPLMGYALRSRLAGQ